MNARLMAGFWGNDCWALCDGPATGPPSLVTFTTGLPVSLELWLIHSHDALFPESTAKCDVTWRKERGKTKKKRARESEYIRWMREWHYLMVLLGGRLIIYIYIHSSFKFMRLWEQDIYIFQSLGVLSGYKALLQVFMISWSQGMAWAYSYSPGQNTRMTEVMVRFM